MAPLCIKAKPALACDDLRMHLEVHIPATPTLPLPVLLLTLMCLWSAAGQTVPLWDNGAHCSGYAPLPLPSVDGSMPCLGSKLMLGHIILGPNPHLHGVMHVVMVDAHAKSLHQFITKNMCR